MDKEMEFKNKSIKEKVNGSFEMIEDDGLLSVIYLAEESDVMREETDMALCLPEVLLCLRL